MPENQTFTPHDWYWRADDGRIFGSARGDVVPAADDAFAAWSADGRRPTPWPRDEAGDQSDAALRDVLAPSGIAVGLDDAKARLGREIDDTAERVRLTLITPGAGQAMEYQEAQAQAVAALKSPTSATAEKYPMLAVSIGIDIDPQTSAPAADVLGVARSIQAARDIWLVIGSEIRGVRLGAKKAIDEAATIEAAEAAAATASWPTAPP